MANVSPIVHYASGVKNLFTSFQEASNVLSCAVAVVPELEPHKAFVREMLAWAAPQPSDMAASAQVVAVEGLDGSGKSTLVRELAAELGGRAAETPPERMQSARDAFDQVGGSAARAYYMVSNYAFAREALTAGGLHVVDRWYGSTVAYTVGRDGRAVESMEASTFRWPRDLPRPAIVLLLEVSEAVRVRRVAERGGQPTTNPWDERLRRDQALGQRIVEALRRLDVPVVTIDANRDVVDVVRAARSAASRALEPQRTPLGELRASAARLGLCESATGRRARHALWTCALSVGQSLRFVGVACVDDFGIYLHVAGAAGGGRGDPTSRREAAHLVLLQGEYPREEQWRAQDGVVARITRAEFEHFCGPPPPSFEPCVQRACAADVVFVRFVPSRLERLVGGPSSPGGPCRTRWEREEAERWSPPMIVPAFSAPGTTLPPEPLVATVVLVAVVGDDNDSLGTEVARIFGWNFATDEADLDGLEGSAVVALGRDRLEAHLEAPAARCRQILSVFLGDGTDEDLAAQRNDRRLNLPGTGTETVRRILHFVRARAVLA